MRVDCNRDETRQQAHMLVIGIFNGPKWENERNLTEERQGMLLFTCLVAQWVDWLVVAWVFERDDL